MCLYPQDFRKKLRLIQPSFKVQSIAELFRELLFNVVYCGFIIVKLERRLGCAGYAASRLLLSFALCVLVNVFARPDDRRNKHGAEQTEQNHADSLQLAETIQSGNNPPQS